MLDLFSSETVRRAYQSFHGNLSTAKMAGKDSSAVTTMTQTVVFVGIVYDLSNLNHSVLQRHFLHDRLVSVKSFWAHCLFLFVVLATAPATLCSLFLQFCAAINHATFIAFGVIV